MPRAPNPRPRRVERRAMLVAFGIDAGVATDVGLADLGCFLAAIDTPTSVVPLIRFEMVEVDVSSP